MAATSSSKAFATGPRLAVGHSEVACGEGSIEDGASEWPLVSIQLITYNRPALLAQALGQIAAQDYLGPIEVIIVDDSPESAQSLLQRYADVLDVRYVYVSRRTIGEKRNIAVSEARGEIMCIWDDDDIFTVDRVRQQVSRMVARGADCSSIAIAFVYSAVDTRLYRCKGLPLPFENTFCLHRKFMAGRAFSNTSSGEGIDLFKHLADWYSEAQPVPGDELPFLYFRMATSTAPTDALELYPVGESFLIPSKDGGALAATRLDIELLALARALRRRRFPACLSDDGGHAQGSAALGHVRRLLAAALRHDASALRTNGDSSRCLAAAYWAALGGPLGATLAASVQPGGEAPEGSANLALAPSVSASAPPRWRPGATEEAAVRVDEVEAGMPLEEILELIASAAEEL